jgi:hypothetical protein
MCGLSPKLLRNENPSHFSRATAALDLGVLANSQSPKADGTPYQARTFAMW